MRRNQNPEIVELLQEKPLQFRCKKCGQRWNPTVLPNGRLAHGSWQCPNGCKPDIAELPMGMRTLLEGFMRDLAEIQADRELAARTDEKMMAIQCRLAIREYGEKLAEFGNKGIIRHESLTKSDEWRLIENEASPLERLNRRIEFARSLLKKIEDELKWIRSKWGLQDQ